MYFTYSSTILVVLSFEPLSTIIISIGKDVSWDNNESKHAAICFSSLYVGIITLIIRFPINLL